MNKEHREKNKKSIMDKIKSNEVSMKPRVYFILRSVAIATGIIFVLGALLYIASFILFSLRINGIFALPSFGFPGLLILFSSLPWLLIVIAIILIGILETLSKNFSLIYRQPLLYSIVAIVIIVGGIGVLVDKTPFHSKTFNFVDRHHIPGGPAFYERFGRPSFENATPGTIVSIDSDGFIIEDPRGEQFYVSTSSDTRFPRGTTTTVDDTVMVIGTKNLETMTIEAEGIRTFDPKMRFRDFPKPLRINFLEESMK